LFTKLRNNFFVFIKGGTLIFFRPVLAPAKGGKPDCEPIKTTLIIITEIPYLVTNRIFRWHYQLRVPTVAIINLTEEFLKTLSLQ
jgi:hypothetical protein